MKLNRVHDTRLLRDVYFPVSKDLPGWRVWRVSRVIWGPRFCFRVPHFEPLFLGLILKGRVRTGEDWAEAGSVLCCGAGSPRDHQADPQTGAEMLICVSQGQKVIQPFYHRGISLPVVLRPAHPERLENRWNAWLESGESARPEAGHIAGLLAEALCWEMLSEAQAPASAAEAMVQQTRKYLLATLEERPKMSTIAAELGVSRVYLNRIFREKTGETPFQFQQRQQMLRATAYLLEGWSVKETAEQLHWPDQGSFSKAYLRVRGVSPGEVGRGRKD